MQNSLSSFSDLKLAADRIFDWFYNNAIKATRGKSHLLSSLDLNISAQLENYVIENKKSPKILRITIGDKLTFHEHVSNICDKACRNINVYFITLFNYCSLV